MRALVTAAAPTVDNNPVLLLCGSVAFVSAEGGPVDRAMHPDGYAGECRGDAAVSEHGNVSLRELRDHRDGTISWLG